MYESIKQIVTTAEKKQQPISSLIIAAEVADSGVSREDVWNKMKRNLETMRAAVKKGETGKGVHSPTGLTGGEAIKVKKYREQHKSLSGDAMMGAVQAALATNEVNAALGVICATPTADLLARCQA